MTDSLLERNAGNGMDTSETITKYYRALGRLIAFRRNGSLYWVGTDHLGGTVAVASSSFGLVAGMRYSPYGVSRDNTDDPLTDNLFTSQKLDASIGLYWYGSRAYDQSLGRFVSPDTIVPSAGNPQSMNRYAYTLNNPLRYADPSGHNPYDGQGVVVYDNPSYLPVEQRQALYEHNSEPRVSNGSQGTVQVHESSGGGGGGSNPFDAFGPVILELKDPSYLPVEQRQALYQHNMTVSNSGSTATYSSLAAAVDPLPSSGGNIRRDSSASPTPMDTLVEWLHGVEHGQPFETYSLNYANDIIGLAGGVLSRGEISYDPRGNLVYSNVQSPISDIMKAINNTDKDVAVTIGHNILNTGSFDLSSPQGAWWYAHEDAHVLQSQILGKLYLPVYALCTAAALGRHDSNVMEQMADSYANKYSAEYQNP